MEALPAPRLLRPPPAHVAIIMDGNGRWAKRRSLPRTAGHRRGVEAVRETVKAATDLGIGYLTLYGFSSENWNRPPTEVDDLMGCCASTSGAKSPSCIAMACACAASGIVRGWRPTSFA